METTNKKAVGPAMGETAQDSNFSHDSSAQFKYQPLTADLYGRIIACNHAHTEVRARRIADGRIQHIRQCVRCHRSVGSPVKQTQDVPAFDEANFARIEAQIAEYEARTRAETAEVREREREDWGRQYDAYLAGEEWAKRRARIMRRAQGVCEGCHDAAAQHVHHLTYEHAFHEFDFELVALCAPCHERIHGSAQ